MTSRSRDERTGKRVAATAGRVLGFFSKYKPKGAIQIYWRDDLGSPHWEWLQAKDFEAVFASALTQAAPRPKVDLSKPKRGKGAKRLGRSIVRRGLKRPRKKHGSKVWTA